MALIILVPRGLIYPSAFQVARKGSRNRWLGLVGEHAAAKVMQQGKVKPWIRQVETLLASQLGYGRCASQGADALTPSVLPSIQVMLSI